MPDHVEDRVRTICSRVLNISPQNIRPESLLYLDEIEPDGLRRIHKQVERAFGIVLEPNIQWHWITVADVVIATERAIAADQQRRAA